MNGLMTWVIEWMAPKEHFKNFKHWQLSGGIDGFLKRYDCKPLRKNYLKIRPVKLFACLVAIHNYSYFLFKIRLFSSDRSFM